MRDKDTARPSHEDEEGTLGSRIADNLDAYTSVSTDFYRGEVDRMTTWRSRLDQTTNWAVVVVGAILTWAFSSSENPHYVILIGVFGLTAFLVMEANRYQEYDIWRDRVRTLQAELFADVYAPERDQSGQSDDWQAKLGDELRDPGFNISFFQALNHRLRRSYLALLLILLVAWIARITVYQPSTSWRQTAGILVLPGEVVVGAVAGFYVFLVALTAWSARGGRVREFEE